jgi:hypothetical protein
MRTGARRSLRPTDLLEAGDPLGVLCQPERLKRLLLPDRVALAIWDQLKDLLAEQNREWFADRLLKLKPKS